MNRRKLKTLVSAANILSSKGDYPRRKNLDRAINLAKLAEKEKITGLFMADLLQLTSEGLEGNTGTQDPLITLTALSQATSRIGLVATVSTSWIHPYNFARQIGTLDHVSLGRAAWNAVTSSVGEENFGDSPLPHPSERYERAKEFIEVINALFAKNGHNSLATLANGNISIDHSLFDKINYNGNHFSVTGPLNVPELPQLRPIQFQAGQSESGVNLGAKYAEVVYTSQSDFQSALEFSKKLRDKSNALGRGNGLPLIMNSLHCIIGENQVDVEYKLARKYESINLEKGRLKVADMLGGNIDLSEFDLGKALPVSILPNPSSINRRIGRAEIFYKLASQGLTLRELIFQAEETGHWFVAGTPEALADAIQQRYDAGILDVVSLKGLGNPEQEDLLVNGLLPILRKRKILDSDYIGDTFRENLQLTL